MGLHIAESLLVTSTSISLFHQLLLEINCNLQFIFLFTIYFCDMINQDFGKATQRQHLKKSDLPTVFHPIKKNFDKGHYPFLDMLKGSWVERYLTHVSRYGKPPRSLTIMIFGQQCLIK